MSRARALVSALVATSLLATAGVATASPATGLSGPGAATPVSATESTSGGASGPARHGRCGCHRVTDSCTLNPLAANGFASPACTSPVLGAGCQPPNAPTAPCPASMSRRFRSRTTRWTSTSPRASTRAPATTSSRSSRICLVTPVWTAVVWLVHVVLIALEWCYAIDLLGPQTLTRVSSSLGAAQRIFTNPWIGLALAVAAAAFAWQGLVRRRVHGHARTGCARRHHDLRWPVDHRRPGGHSRCGRQPRRSGGARDRRRECHRRPEPAGRQR